MRKMLNTLFVTQDDIYIGCKGKNIVIKNSEEKIQQFPIQYFENIICFNYTGMSPSAMALCIENNVGISFLSPNGKFKAKVVGKNIGNVLLRMQQFKIAQNKEEALKFAKLFMSGKLYNSVKILDRGLRDYKDREFYPRLLAKKELLLASKEKIKSAEDFDELLGIEGDAARNYFSGFNELILKGKEIYCFKNRNRRPPLDPTNTMLSMGYSLLGTLMENALVSVGLDPYVGFLHSLRPGRRSLALDVIEELRSFMVDRFVLNLINRKEIDKKDFFFKNNGVVLFTDQGFKKFLNLWQKRMQREINHPFLEEKINIGLIPFVQAMLLARVIRGDMDLYPPFMME